MKINRHKKVTKYLNYYRNNYGFFKPYQVLIDGTFCYVALKNQVNIQEQLPKYLGEVKLLTTQCIILETEKLGKYVFGAMLIVKNFAVHQCGHGKNPVSGSACIESMIGENNASRYIIATQDQELQDAVRRIPGAPLLYLHHKTPTLEEPSKVSIKVANKQCHARFGVSEHDSKTLSGLKLATFGPQQETKPKKKKKKGGPNPLSCKKKQKKPNSNENKSADKKRKRKRIKLPKHVKTELLSNNT